MTRVLDSMFARTALLAVASAVAFAVLFLAIGRGVAGLPAIRASATALADAVAGESRLLAQSEQGPPPAALRDAALGRTLLWQTFADAMEKRLGPGSQFAIRADNEGAIVWARISPSANWAHWHTQLPSHGLRAGLLAFLAALAAAVLVAGVLLARQITGPLRHLAGIADRFAAGEPPPDRALSGPREVRRVHEAFQRLCDSLRISEQEREATLAGVSHDMRTPISRLRFVMELYSEGASARLLDEIGRELDELEQVASRFVAYARSNYEEPFSPRVLDTLVMETIRSCTFADCVAFEPGAPAPLDMQPGNLHAMVENLLENARKHGSVPIHVRTEQSDGEVRVVVRDSGDGIPADKHATALRPFTRCADHDAPGSGLGLAIVARVAKRHGGGVEMRNRPDGFEVRVTLRAPAAA